MAGQKFPLKEARGLVIDFMTPDPAIYWSDFLISVLLGWASFAIALFAPYPSFLFFAAYIAATLALYRPAIFIHELAHLRKGAFRLFRFIWNVICGIPLLIPSFTYDGVHNDHHKPDVYGTDLDGEYIPFAVNKPFGTSQPVERINAHVERSKGRKRLISGGS